MTLEAPRGRRGSPTSSHQRRQQPAERGGSTTRQARITDFFAPPVRTLRAAPSRACSHPEPVALTAEAQCHSEAQAGGPARAQPSTGGAEQARFVEEAASTRTSTSTSTSPSPSSPSTPEAEAPLEGQPQAEGQKAPIASRPPTHAGGMAAGQGRLEDTHQHAEVAGQARLERRIFGREVAGTLVGRGLDRADAATVAAGACRAHVAAVAADAGSGKLASRFCSPSRPSERAVTVADAGRQAAPVPLAQSCAVEVETEVGHQRLLAPTDIAPPVRKRDRRPIGFASHNDGQVAAVHDSTLPSLRTNVNALCRPPDIVAKPHWVDLFRTAADESDSRTMPVEWTWKEGTADAITSDDTMLSSTDMKQRHRTPGRPLDVVVSGPVDVQCLTTGSDGGGTLAFSFATPPPTPRASRGRPHGRPPDLHGSSKVGVQDATMDAIVKKFHIGGDRPPDLSPGRPPEPEASQGHTDAVDDMNRELARLLGEITLMCASANANEISTSRRVPRHFGWLNLDSAHPEPPPLSEGSRGQPSF